MKTAGLAILFATAACSAPAYSLRVPVQHATYGSLVSAATDAMDATAGGLDRIDAPGVIRIHGSKGVEEVEVVLERGRDETKLEVFISRPELYPPGVGEAFWRHFRQSFDATRKSWSMVESGERSARL